MKLPYSIESQRLVIRPFKGKDIDSLYQLMTDKKSMEFTILQGENINYKYCKDYIYTIMDSYFSEQPIFAFAIIFKEINKCIGTLGLMPLNEDFELYFTLHSEYWDRGLGKETVSTFIRYCFNEWQLDKLYTFVSPENTRSIHLLKGLSFIYQETAPHPKYRQEQQVYIIKKFNTI